MREEGGNVDRQKADIHTLSFSWIIHVFSPVDYLVSSCMCKAVKKICSVTVVGVDVKIASSDNVGIKGSCKRHQAIENINVFKSLRVLSVI